MSKVYIIEHCDAEWSSELEVVAATLYKDKAKALLKTYINICLDNAQDEGYFDSKYVDEEDPDVEKREDYNDIIEEFINDMVEGKTDDHYTDEFPGGNVWCIVMELQ